MGAYINPNGVSKQDWLEAHGIEMTENDCLEEADYTATMPVCLVNNGAFLAAAVGYKLEEAKYFAEPDGRPKQWFLVKVADLHEVSPELSNYVR